MSNKIVKSIKMHDDNATLLSLLAKRQQVSFSQLMSTAARAHFEKHAQAYGVFGCWHEDENTHGGNRYYQCENCGGWNVGKTDAGVLACADCGWHSGAILPHA